MKIAAVIGSPHGMKGATGMMLQAVVDSARKEGAEVSLFSLADLDVNPCRACNVCHETGECSISDDFSEIKSALEESDGVLFASPNYMFSVSAQMKALMDRCCGLVHLQKMRHRYAAAVVTSGGAESQEVIDYLLRFGRAMGCWSVGGVGAAGWEMGDKAGKERRISDAASLGKQMAQAIREEKRYPAQEANLDGFADRMRQLVAMQKDEWAFEYEYWQKAAE